MQSGIIGQIKGDFSSLDSFASTKTEQGHELTNALDVRSGQLSLTDDVRVTAGRAMKEQLVDYSYPIFEGEKIITREETRKDHSYTEFRMIPGEFVVVGQKDGKFAFNMIQAQTDSHISRPSIDLDEYAETRPNADPWKFGFEKSGGNAEQGVIYGHHVTEDPDMGDVLERSEKNQLGLIFRYNGKRIKINVAATGYVEIIEPSVTTETYIKFIQDEIKPHWS